MKLPEEFQFLAKVRFWAMTIAAASYVLVDPATQTRPWYVSLGIFLGVWGAGFWGTQTIDRTAEHLGKTETEAKVEAKEEVKEKKEDN